MKIQLTKTREKTKKKKLAFQTKLNDKRNLREKTRNNKYGNKNYLILKTGFKSKVKKNFF